MRTTTAIALSVPGLLASTWLGISGCSHRASDCNWNENCETGGATAAGGGNGGGTSGDSGKGGTNAKGGTTGGSTGGRSSASSGGASAASTTAVCSGLPDDTCGINETYGVFVSPKGDDSGNGSQAAPFATLNRALIVAKADLQRRHSVYLCATAGDFTPTETILIDSPPVNIYGIYGGFDCSQPNWTYKSDTLKTNFISKATIAVKLDGLNGTNAIPIKNLKFQAADATKAGDSSIAMLAVNSPSVTLTNVELVAGKGADGAAGTSETVPVGNGTEGIDGTAACDALPSGAYFHVGAASVSTTCEGVLNASTSGRGGIGGDGTNPAGSGGDGTPTQALGTFGLGGLGQGGMQPNCTKGNDGADGTPGTAIAPPNGYGTLAATGFTPINGKDGNPGKPGQGGGGGGGSKAAAALCKDNNQSTGPSGASGGSGGCGGKAGHGGQGGGASIALALVNSPLTLDSCTLTAAKGGAGGNGIAGQVGGRGGNGGKAGTTIVSGGSFSCAGGAAGKGGNGSAGGGGAGGHSLAIGYVGKAPIEGSNGTTTTNTKKHDAGGVGGADGDNSTVAPGPTGIAADSQSLGG